MFALFNSNLPIPLPIPKTFLGLPVPDIPVPKDNPLVDGMNQIAGDFKSNLNKGVPAIPGIPVLSDFAHVTGGLTHISSNGLPSLPGIPLLSDFAHVTGGLTHISSGFKIPGVPDFGGLADAVGNLTKSLNNFSLSDFLTNGWNKFYGPAKIMTDKVVHQVKTKIEEFMEPYKHYIRVHRVLVNFIAVASGFLLIPIILYVVVALIAILGGLLVFTAFEGTFLVVGFLGLASTLLVIATVALIIGTVIVGVINIIEWIDEWISRTPMTAEEAKEVSALDKFARNLFHHEKEISTPMPNGIPALPST